VRSGNRYTDDERYGYDESTSRRRAELGDVRTAASPR